MTSRASRTNTSRRRRSAAAAPAAASAFLLVMLLALQSASAAAKVRSSHDNAAANGANQGGRPTLEAEAEAEAARSSSRGKARGKARGRHRDLDFFDPNSDLDIASASPEPPKPPSKPAGPAPGPGGGGGSGGTGGTGGSGSGSSGTPCKPRCCHEKDPGADKLVGTGGGPGGPSGGPSGPSPSGSGGGKGGGKGGSGSGGSGGPPPPGGRKARARKARLLAAEAEFVRLLMHDSCPDHCRPGKKECSGVPKPPPRPPPPEDGGDSSTSDGGGEGGQDEGEGEGEGGHDEGGDSSTDGGEGQDEGQEGGSASDETTVIEGEGGEGEGEGDEIGTEIGTDIGTDESPVGGGSSSSTETAIVPGIQDINTDTSCGQKLEGSSSVKVAFYFDVVTDPNIIDVDDVDDYFENNTFTAAGFCPEEEATSGVRRRLLLLLALRSSRTLQSGGGLIGAEQCGTFAPNEDPNQVCQSVQFDPTTGNECGQYRGEFCGYCDGDVTSDYDCGILGLQAMETGLEDLVNPEEGIVAVQYLGGDIDSITPTTTGDTGGGNADGVAAASVGVESRSGDEDGLSTVGKGLIAGAVVGLVLVAFLAVRRKKSSSQTKEIGFLDDEDLYSTGNGSDKIPFSPGDSLDGTEIMSSDMGSPRSSRWRKARPGHIVGEDDSVATNRQMDMNELQLAESSAVREADANNLSQTHAGVDVHHCASAMCEVCSAKRQHDPTFVSTAIEDFEIDIGNDEGDDVNTSINSGLSYASRTYPMEDTVDF